jgi:hypothetical protein
MSKTASVGEGLTVASAQKRATKMFMSGAAQVKMMLMMMLSQLSHMHKTKQNK